MELQKIYTDGQSKVLAFAESRIGGRPENQDSYGWANTNLGYLVVVCDGMGGGPGGKTASSIAVKEIIAGISEASADEEITNIIIKAVRRANMAIMEYGSEKPALKGMGSTATVLLVNENSAFAAHVGDSRIYQLRGSKKVFRTFDHSMVFEMVAGGVITEEQARLSAQSNVITRALGIRPDVEVDVAELPYLAGDRFVLCSDGIHGSMAEVNLIKRFSNRNGKLAAITDDIATEVDNIGRSSGGGHDNLTLAIVETKHNSKLKTKMSKQIKFIIIGLTALFFVSAALNIVQCNESSQTSILDQNSQECSKDTIIKLKSDSIKALSADLSRIGELLNAEGDAPSAAMIDTIRQIVKK